MPWRTTSPMDQRRLFANDFRHSVFPFAELCARYGISRKTGYKWVERFLDGGDVASNGEALRLNGADESGSSYAMYRVSLQDRQPGVVSIDANLLVLLGLLAIAGALSALILAALV